MIFCLRTMGPRGCPSRCEVQQPSRSQGDKLWEQNFQVWVVFRLLRPKRAIPHPITMLDMRFRRFLWDDPFKYWLFSILNEYWESCPKDAKFKSYPSLARTGMQPSYLSVSDWDTFFCQGVQIILFYNQHKESFPKIAECIFCCSAKDKQVFEALLSFRHLLLPRLTQRSLSQLPSDCRLNLFSGRNKQAFQES